MAPKLSRAASQLIDSMEEGYLLVSYPRPVRNERPGRAFQIISKTGTHAARINVQTAESLITRGLLVEDTATQSKTAARTFWKLNRDVFAGTGTPAKGE